MDRKNRILFIGHNFSPELTGIGKYSGEMVEWLSKNGNTCTVVTTFPYYPHWQVQKPYSSSAWYKKESVSYPQNNNQFTIYRCPLFVPKELTGLNRVMHDFSFLVSMFFMVLKLILFDKSFDYIITVAPPFHLSYLSLFYRKLRGGKVIYHIQDLQIEAAQKSQLLKGGKFFNMMYRAEKVILKSSDIVSSISEGMIARIQLKIDRQVKLFPNWVQTSAFFPVKDKTNLKKDWGFNNDQFICLYSGSIGEKQGLENIILAAESLKHDPRIQFAVCGTGPYKATLQSMALNRELNNVKFFPLQDKEKFNDFLNMADLHLIVQKAYIGDLVMPSKLPTILSTGGVSLVTAEKGTSLYKLIEKYDVGFVVDPEDYVKLAESIAMVSKQDSSEKQINARRYALKYLNIDNVMNKFTEDISMVSDMQNSLVGTL